MYLLNRVSLEKCTDFIASSDVSLTLIDGQSLSKYSLIVNLNTDTSFVGIGALIAHKLISKAQICIHQHTRAVAFGPKQILEQQANKSARHWAGLARGRASRRCQHNSFVRRCKNLHFQN